MRVIRLFYLLRVSFVLTLLACVGCSDHGYDVARVKGVVKVDGQLITAGKVIFAPRAKEGSVSAGKPGQGLIEPDGTFEISTYGNKDGAVVADHYVRVINTRPDTESGKRLMAKEIRVGQSLTVVSGQENEFTIELSSNDIKKQGRRQRLP